MDAILNRIKQIGTGLNFTLDKELCATNTYVAYKGRYREHKVTIFRYKQEHANAAAEAFPLLKHITHPFLARIISSQRTASSFYLITERTLPIRGADNLNSDFVVFVQSKIRDCNRKIQNEHGIKICAVDGSGISRRDIYFTEEGRPVVAGVLPRFIKADETQEREDLISDAPESQISITAKKKRDPSPKTISDACIDPDQGLVSADSPVVLLLSRIDSYVGRYAELSRAEHEIVYDGLRKTAADLPEMYAAYISKQVLGYIEKQKYSREKERKIFAARTLLLLNPGTHPVVLLFSVQDPEIRVLAFKILREISGPGAKREALPGILSSAFEDIHGSVLHSEAVVRMEVLDAIPGILSALTSKQKEKVLGVLSVVLKKGKGKEREKASALILSETLEFLEAPGTLYRCVETMLTSADTPVKRNGIYLLDEIKEALDIHTLVLEVVPLVSSQCICGETADASSKLLCELANRVRRDIQQLKTGEKWKVPGISILTRQPPIRPNPPLAERLREKRDAETKKRAGTDWDQIEGAPDEEWEKW